EDLVEVPGEGDVRQRGRLVRDRVGVRPDDGLAHGARVEEVELHRLRSERPYPVGATGRVEGADHLVPALDQLRHQPGADRAACSCYEDPHFDTPCVTSPAFRGSYLYDRLQGPGVTD